MKKHFPLRPNDEVSKKPQNNIMGLWDRLPRGKSIFPPPPQPQNEITSPDDPAEKNPTPLELNSAKINVNSYPSKTNSCYKISLSIKLNDFYNYLINQQKFNNSDQQRLKKVLINKYKKDCDEIAKNLFPDYKGDCKSKLFESAILIPLKSKSTNKITGNETNHPISLPILCNECHHCETMDLCNLEFKIPNYENLEKEQNENHNQMKDEDDIDEPIINPNILVKCTICNKCTDISKLYVEERIYRLLKFFDISNISRLNLLVIPKDSIGSVYSIEDIVRYDTGASNSLSNKTKINLNTFASTVAFMKLSHYNSKINNLLQLL